MGRADREGKVPSMIACRCICLQFCLFYPPRLGKLEVFLEFLFDCL